MFEEYTFTLASASPRRRELLKGLDISFTVEPGKDEKEAYSADLPLDAIPAFLARHKSETFHRALAPREVLITADTLVFLDEKILGKPRDRAEAVAMLQALSGRTHTVTTGVALRTPAMDRPCGGICYLINSFKSLCSILLTSSTSVGCELNIGGFCFLK